MNDKLNDTLHFGKDVDNSITSDETKGVLSIEELNEIFLENYSR